MGDMKMNKFILFHFPSSNLQTSKTILIEKSKGMPIQITWEKKKISFSTYSIIQYHFFFFLLFIYIILIQKIETSQPKNTMYPRHHHTTIVHIGNEGADGQYLSHHHHNPPLVPICPCHYFLHCHHYNNLSSLCYYSNSTTSGILNNYNNKKPLQSTKI